MPFCNTLSPLPQAPVTVYHDEHLLVVDKPAGMLAVPGRGVEKADCLITRVQRQFPEALVVHRLDMATSGLMLLARGAGMQRLLSMLFRDRQIRKRYVALVTGRTGSAGEIELPLGADWPNRPRQKLDFLSGKPSLTRYRLLGSESDASSRIELEPVTGRTHQLRLHLSSIGHPILGDTLYDGTASERLMLHAYHLEFVHPASREQLTVECAVPF